MISPPIIETPLPVINLKVPFLNSLFEDPSSGLAVGTPLQVYKEQTGDYKVVISKPSENILNVRISKVDPNTNEV